MKKIVSIIICLSMLMCSAFYSNATCAHSYADSYVSASCVDKAYTLSICSLCGHTIKTYDHLYTEPDGCYFLIDGVKDGDMLNVSVKLFNNPGFWANRLTLNYNTEALEVVSTEKGTVWPATATVTINSAPASGSPYIRFYCENTMIENNTNNGLVFSVSFKIKGEMDDWGISMTTRAKDNINTNNQSVSFQTIDTVTVGYGDHVYDEGTILSAPTYEAQGKVIYSCTLCDNTKEEIIPALEKIWGDSNLDGKLNSIDVIELKKYIAGLPADIASLDFMDTNQDGLINAKDLLILKKMILKTI